MNTVDLLLQGGKVVNNRGVRQADLVIHMGKIAAMLEPGCHRDWILPARETLDISGKFVLPGVIDVHGHHREPGFTHKEDILSATGAAAAGGVTVSVGMPNVNPPPNNLETLREILQLYQRKSIVDYNMNPAATRIDEIPRLAEEGILAFKLFMIRDTGRTYPHMPGIGLHHHGDLYRVFQAVAETGLPLMVHPHDQDLMETLEQEYQGRYGRDYLSYARAFSAHQGIFWDTAVAALLRLQEATGVHLHILHVITPGMIEMIRRARERGSNVTCEVNAWGLFLGGNWEIIEEKGPYALGFFIPPDHLEKIWGALKSGVIDILTSDHTPHTTEEKEVGWKDMWKAPGGTPQIQFYLSLLLDEVNRGRLKLEDAVRILSYRSAEIFGLLPDKGEISVGSDADLVIVDLEKTETLSNEQVLSRCGWTPYHGKTVKGIPELTMVRGKIVARNGKVTAQPGTGRQARPCGAGGS